jgi:hypothetical protein
MDIANARFLLNGIISDALPISPRPLRKPGSHPAGGFYKQEIPMSAFIVSKTTLERAVAVVLKMYEPDHRASMAEVDALARKLWGMNREAVIVRYGIEEASSDLTDEELAAYTYGRSMVSKNFTRKALCQLHKAMCCLTYQCSEGDVPETALYHQCEAARDDLADTIVRSLPEWEKAVWDGDVLPNEGAAKLSVK